MVKDYGSGYFDNYAIYGGAVSASNTSMEFNETAFQKHNATMGGVFHIENESKLYVFECDIQNNIAF